MGEKVTAVLGRRNKILCRAKELVPQIVTQTTQEILDNLFYQKAIMRHAAINIVETVSLHFMEEN